jgi:predicted DNA-binding transcriptional regulator YafY
MNKTDRLLAIVLKLQSSGGMRAEDLAAFFETSKRTIYRDIQALSEAGVPLIATPGQGYALVEGYFLPPLSFTSDEAIMLLLGAEYLAQNFDDRYRDGAKAAAFKIEGVLPQKLAQEVNNLKSSFRMVTQPIENPELLKELRRAVLERKTIKFRYYGRALEPGRETATEREVDPYGLIFVEGVWYLPGYDYLRQDIRNFRLDRVENLAFTTKTFTRRPGFVLGKIDTNDIRNITVRLLFTPEAARWVRETRYFYIAREEDTPEGLLVTLRVRHERDPLNWILSWGRRVRVLEPASLIKIVREEAEAISNQYKIGD